MKNLFIKIFLILCFLFNFTGINLVHAGCKDDTKKICVEVTEKIPGAKCNEECVYTSGTNSGQLKSNCYVCEIEPGFSQIQVMIGQMIKFFTMLAALVGVLFIVINGIMLSMSGMDGGGGKDETKKKIIKAIIGLVILLLSGVILSSIAPWIYK